MKRKKRRYHRGLQLQEHFLHHLLHDDSLPRRCSCYSRWKSSTETLLSREGRRGETPKPCEGKELCAVITFKTKLLRYLPKLPPPSRVDMFVYKTGVLPSRAWDGHRASYLLSLRHATRQKHTRTHTHHLRHIILLIIQILFFVVMFWARVQDCLFCFVLVLTD